MQETVRESDTKHQERELVNHFHKSWHAGWNPPHHQDGTQTVSDHDSEQGKHTLNQLIGTMSDELGLLTTTPVLY